MKHLLTWVFSALLFAAIGGFGVWIFMEGREKGHEEGEKTTATAPGSEPAELPVVSRDKTGAVVVRLEREIQQRVGLKVAPLAAAVDEPETVAFGVVQEDPALLFSLRSPLPGKVLADPSGRWVSFGQSVAAKAVVGAILPRLGPAEQADMASKLAAAHAEEQGARASLDALRISLDIKRKLSTGQDKIVSEQVLQEAEAKVKIEEARLQGARDTVRVLEGYVHAVSRPAAETVPLIASQAGRVVEVLVQPGESVEAGQSLLKLASHERLFARVSLPAGHSIEKPGAARIILANDENHPLPADEALPAPAADTATGGQTFVFAFRPGRALVQPGMPAIAHIKIPGEPIQGVIVPPDAVLRHGGAGWVYVQSGQETFVRREVPLDRLLAQGWFIPAGVLSPGDPVVVQAAQSVLSHELKHQAGGGEEEEEE